MNFNNTKMFDITKRIYKDAIAKSGQRYKQQFNSERMDRCKRDREIIWFDPTFKQSVKVNETANVVKVFQ